MAKKSPDERKAEDKAKQTEAEKKADEKIRREQATKPALMPIGDPAGAA